MTQLALEYDPEPPFQAGTPEKAGADVTGIALAIIGELKPEAVANRSGAVAASDCCVTSATTLEDHAMFEAVLHLGQAWSAGDAAALGATMADDSDFVPSRADHFRGRETVVASHAHVVPTIYAASRNQVSLKSARRLTEDVVVDHARSVLTAPTGPLAGRHEATSAVMPRDRGRRQITSFPLTLASVARDSS